MLLESGVGAPKLDVRALVESRDHAGRITTRTWPNQSRLHLRYRNRRRGQNRLARSVSKRKVDDVLIRVSEQTAFEPDKIVAPGLGIGAGHDIRLFRPPSIDGGEWCHCETRQERWCLAIFGGLKHYHFPPQCAYPWRTAAPQLCIVTSVVLSIHISVGAPARGGQGAPPPPPVVKYKVPIYGASNH